MEIINSINKFYYELSIQELKLMSKNEQYNKMSHNTMLYLNIISCKENCTVSMLSEILNITKSAVTIKVNELVTKGYLKKIQSKSDKRIHYIKLSDSMQNIFDDYDNFIYRTFDKIKSMYNEEQINNFCEIMNFISEKASEEN